MGYFRKTVMGMEAYLPGEQPRAGRSVKLNTNENPYPPSPRVVTAIVEAAGERFRLYPRPMADELRDCAAQVYGLATGNVLVGNGSDDLLAMLFRACIDPGSRVAYPVPTYSLYDTLATLQGGHVVRIPWGAEWTLPDGLLEVDARLILLCNPNSPSGTLVPGDAVRALAERQRGLVVVDEAYVDFAESHCLDLVRDLPNVAVVRSLSKSFSLAGMRIGLLFAPEPIVSTLEKVKDSYNVNWLSSVAGAAALSDMRVMEENVRRIRKARESLTISLRALGFEVVPSQANFVLARRPGTDLGPLQERLRRRGVLVRHFATPELRDALRITVGSDENLRVLLRVLRQLVPDLEDPVWPSVEDVQSEPG